MFGHKDFSRVQSNWDAFWAGKNEKPLYSITVPKNGIATEPRPPYLSGFDGNYKEAADILARWYESCEFYGDAVPYYPISFGSDDFASFLGADLVLSPNRDTSWPVHTLTQLEGAEIAFDKNGKWWGKLVDFHSVLKKTLGEEVLLCAPTLTSGLDALVGLYGAENLIYDMVDNPEAVHSAVKMVNAAHTEIFNECAKLFEFEKYGSANRHGMYSTGRINLPQCDFSCMISPEMFEEFAIPSIEHEFNNMDAGEYHLDGPDALKHLERLAKIPNLHVIQWVAGEGEAATKDWTELYKKIVSLGKGLILGGNREHMIYLQNQLKTPRIFASIGGIKSKTEAEDFLGEMDEMWKKMREED